MPVGLYPDLVGKRIILVEDDAVNRFTVSQVLQSAGCEVLPFPDYQGALSEIESDRLVDLLVTDIKLPPGTPHGISLAQMARERRRSLPVVFITAFEDLGRMVDPDLGEVILKPIDPAMFLVGVQTACGVAGDPPG